MSEFEQRENVKFCQKLGKSASETFSHDQASVRRRSLGRSAVWHKSFACPRRAAKTTGHRFATLDLAPCDYFFFPRLKEKLRGRRFLSAEEIVAATREAVWDLPTNTFQQCFQQLYQRWQTCIAANGDCFEGECEYE
jgi:hypothetical protein